MKARLAFAQTRTSLPKGRPSNNVSGDQITHVHNKQNTAVTAMVAAFSASGGFFGGIFASKAFSRNNSPDPPATTIPLPPPQSVTSASSSDTSLMTIASNLSTRMVHGAPLPPDPGPVKIGEPTKDCLQALLGGKDKLEPARAKATRAQDGNDVLTQEMLKRMVAQTVLTAAIPHVTIKL